MCVSGCRTSPYIDNHNMLTLLYFTVFCLFIVPMDGQSWSGIGWSGRDGVDNSIQSIHQKLVDLKTEMQKLNDDSGGQLLFVSDLYF